MRTPTQISALCFCHTSVSLVLAMLRLTSRANVVHTTLPTNSTLLLTGKFSSARWLYAHIKPLLESSQFDRILIVSDQQLFDEERVYWIRPSHRIRKLGGATLARLWTFSRFAATERPCVVGGFHLLLNGVVAIVLGRLFRLRSLYFCVGGPAEIQDGGLLSENRLFSQIGKPSQLLEQKLARLGAYSDYVVYMGRKAERFYADLGHSKRTLVNPGGISRTPVIDESGLRDIDVLFVGRLEAIKDIPLFLETVVDLKNRFPMIRVSIVGDGSARESLENLANALELTGNVRFAGFQSNIESWLRRSKVFLLTSKSEGLSLAIMEALSTGVPVVAPNIGDLGDAVVSNQTGFLVNSRSPQDYSNAVAKLLGDDDTLARMKLNALAHSQNFSVEAAARKWRHLFQ